MMHILQDLPQQLSVFFSDPDTCFQFALMVLAVLLAHFLMYLYKTSSKMYNKITKGLKKIQQRILKLTCICAAFIAIYKAAQFFFEILKNANY